MNKKDSILKFIRGRLSAFFICKRLPFFNSNLGITMMEMITVISIMGIIAAILTPTFSNYLSYHKLSTASKEISITLKKAQQLSVTEQIKHSVTFYPIPKAYTTKRITESGSETIETKTLPGGIDIHTIDGLTDNEVQFNSAGAPSSPGTIILINDKGKESKIEIKASGHIKTD